ncbi:MAG: hypothetical protein ACT4QA_15040 [Panacagrimonas sp.]
MKRAVLLVLVGLYAVPITVPATEADPAGTTILGDQDAAVGLYLTPWKDEEPAELDRAPGLHDEAPAALDAASFARTHTYYSTVRAWRAERLQKNR